MNNNTKQQPENSLLVRLAEIADVLDADGMHTDADDVTQALESLAQEEADMDDTVQVDTEEVTEENPILSKADFIELLRDSGALVADQE